VERVTRDVVTRQTIIPRMKHDNACVCVAYSLETDGGGDGVQDRVRMRKVREPPGLNALEVHGLKTEITTV